MHILFKEGLSVVEKLLQDFSAKKLGALVVSLVTILVVVLVFEEVTGYFHWKRLAQGVDLLSNLTEIQKSGALEGDDQLRDMYTALSQEVKEVVVGELPTDGPNLLVLWKGLAGAAPWLLIALWVVWFYLKKKKKPTMIGVILPLVCGLVFGALGTLLPDAPTINYVLYPIGHVVVLCGVIAWTTVIATLRDEKDKKR